MTVEQAQEHLEEVKLYLNVTWSDDDTDKKLIAQMRDAEAALCHKLGAADISFFEPGQEHRLYMTYMDYAWNKCLNDFDSAYMAEILQLRHKYEVRTEGDSDEG